MAKFSVSLPDEMYEEIRQAAGPGGISAWLAEAAEHRLRSRRLAAMAEEWLEESGGPPTEDEIRETERWLGWSSTPES